MRYRTATIRSGGAAMWLLQRFTGLLLVVLLLMHFFLMHFVAGGGVSFETVARRLANPLYQALERLFLAAAVWHAGYGLWLIVVDYLKQAWARMLVLLVFWSVGLGAFVLGWLTVISVSRS